MASSVVNEDLSLKYKELLLINIIKFVLLEDKTWWEAEMLSLELAGNSWEEEGL